MTISNCSDARSQLDRLQALKNAACSDLAKRLDPSKCTQLTSQFTQAKTAFDQFCGSATTSTTQTQPTNTQTQPSLSEVQSVINSIIIRRKPWYQDLFSELLPDKRPFETREDIRKRLAVDPRTKVTSFPNLSAENRAFYNIYLTYNGDDQQFLTNLFRFYPGIERLKFKGNNIYWYDILLGFAPNTISFASNKDKENDTNFQNITKFAPQIIQYIKTKYPNFSTRSFTTTEAQAFVNDVGVKFQIPIFIHGRGFSRAFPQLEGDEGRLILGFDSNTPVFSEGDESQESQDTPEKAAEPEKETPWYKTGVGIAAVVLGVGALGVGTYLVVKKPKQAL